MKQEEGPQGACASWMRPVPEDVRRIVHSLREKIAAAGGNRALLESGQRGSGYRLSTRCTNVELRDVDGDLIEESRNGPK